MNLNDLLGRIAIIMDEDPRNILLPNRQEKLVDCRQAFCILAHYNGYMYKEIGEFLDRDHSSVHHLVNNRPVTNGSLKCINELLISENNNNLVFLASELAKNPENEDIKEQLKTIL